MSSATGFISASFFSGSFGGDGSGLTNVTATSPFSAAGISGSVSYDFLPCRILRFAS